MKYMGSKNRIAKNILPIILKDRKPNQCYAEPFVGGANMIDKVDGNRIGADSNKYLIEMWLSLQDGWRPKEHYSKEEYAYIKNNKDVEPRLTGYVGICCSYSGKWFGGYAGITKTRNGTRNYQDEAYRNVMSQLNNLDGVLFYNESYNFIDALIPDNSILYCDPPYRETTSYKQGDFDHDLFFIWCEDMMRYGHSVFISEYSAPDNFKCVWEKEVSSSLSANGKAGKNKKSTEKLFVHESQYGEK